MANWSKPQINSGIGSGGGGGGGAADKQYWTSFSVVLVDVFKLFLEKSKIFSRRKQPLVF